MPQGAPFVGVHDFHFFTERQSELLGRPDGIEPMLTVTVLEINGGKVRLGFKGDSDVPIHRLEVWERIRDNGRPDVPASGPVQPVAG